MDIPFRKIHIPNYKVKAFLGDSILEFILTKRIYENEHGTIGRMSKRCNHLKSNFYLSKIYDYIVYHKYILSDDRNFNIHSKGTMVEAFICFAYQQKGLDYTEELVNYLYNAIKKWRKPK